jgi:hypothetical protein
MKVLLGFLLFFAASIESARSADFIFCDGMDAYSGCRCVLGPGSQVSTTDNGSDSMLLHDEDACGSHDIIGSRGADGTVTAVIGSNSETYNGRTVRTELDSSGRPVAIVIEPNGSSPGLSLTFTWVDAETAAVSISDSNGLIQTISTINFGNGQTSLLSSNGALILRSLPSTKSFAQSASVLTAPWSVPSYLGRPAPHEIETALTRPAQVTVTQCGNAATHAQVFAKLGGDLAKKEPLIGTPTGTPGVFVVNVPSADLSPQYTVQGWCTSSIDAIKNLPHICDALDASSNSGGGLTGGGVLLVCGSMLEAAILLPPPLDIYGVGLAGGTCGLVEFADFTCSVKDFVCANVTGFPDLFASGSLPLTVFALSPGLPTDLQTSQTHDVLNTGAIDPFELTFDPVLSVEDISINPVAPVPYQPVTASTNFLCAAGTESIVMTVVGSDGYGASQPCGFDTSNSGNCQVTVPGGAPGTTDLVSVEVNGTAQTSAEIVFPTLCEYSYSDWSTCQQNGTQDRIILSSSPPGCIGTPATFQFCAYTCGDSVCSQTQPNCYPPATGGSPTTALECCSNNGVCNNGVEPGTFCCDPGHVCNPGVGCE